MLSREMRKKLTRVIEALLVVRCDEHLSEEQQKAVLGVLDSEGVGATEFTILDSKPGLFGYREREGGWHWKLRQVRNKRDTDLFKVLRKEQ